MPRANRDADRISRDPLGRASKGTFTASNASLKERVGALRNLRPFAMVVWGTSPQLMAASLALRLVRALLPVATLFIGKLIIDDVVALVQTSHKPETLLQWMNSGLLNWLGLLLIAEFALAILADILGRIVSLVDSLLSVRA